VGRGNVRHIHMPYGIWFPIATRGHSTQQLRPKKKLLAVAAGIPAFQNAPHHALPVLLLLLEPAPPSQLTHCRNNTYISPRCHIFYISTDDLPVSPYRRSSTPTHLMH
jgi:hypothetical protein